MEAWWRRWDNLYQVTVAFRNGIIGFLNFLLLFMDILQQKSTKPLATGHKGRNCLQAFKHPMYS